MSDDEAVLFLWIIGGFMGLMLLCFGLYLIGECFSYSGGQGSDDPRGYNEWTML